MRYRLQTFYGLAFGVTWAYRRLFINFGPFQFMCWKP